MDRKLSAILAADVVGYSALMEEDEAGTFTRLLADRKELFEPEIERHHGRVFKLMGDGLFAEFGSVVDAVECAASLQRALADRNEAVPGAKRIQVRIGINLGEVIVEGDDRYGEGVNIAARLEQLAEPGGICVSDKVAREVMKKLSFEFEAMGQQRVKNLAEPIQAYRVRLDNIGGVRLPSARAPRAIIAVAASILVLALAGSTYWFGVKAWQSTVVGETSPGEVDARPSLVVLPFSNLSDDQEQGYLADGITEDLTTELARVPGLFVISRSAAFTYKGKTVNPKDIARELGVQYVLEGSTRRAGEDMRINAQLIDANSGGHVWAERFDGKWADVFKLQDSVVTNIANVLKLRLTTREGTDKMTGGTDNVAAYDAYLKGLALSYRGTPNDVASAVPYFQEALTLDPNFGRASAELAWLYWNASGDRASEASLGISMSEIDDNSNAYFADAAKHPSPIYYMLLAEREISRLNHAAAVNASERGIALDPSNPYIFEEMSWALVLSGRPSEGLDYLDAAMRIDPKWNAGRYVMAALAYISLDRFDDAVIALEKADPQAEDSPYWSSFWLGYQRLRLLISAYGHLGRTADAAKAKAEIASYVSGRGLGEFTVLLAMRDYRFKNDADLDRIVDGLRKAGVPELPFGFDARLQDRLTGPEIKTLLFGHKISGKSMSTGQEYVRTTTPDGASRVSLANNVTDGETRISGDILFFHTSFGGMTCSAVFRNRAGDAANHDEYILVTHADRFTFSVDE